MKGKGIKTPYLSGKPSSEPLKPSITTQKSRPRSQLKARIKQSINQSLSFASLPAFTFNQKHPEIIHSSFLLEQGMFLAPVHCGRANLCGYKDVITMSSNRDSDGKYQDGCEDAMMEAGQSSKDKRKKAREEREEKEKKEEG